MVWVCQHFRSVCGLASICLLSLLITQIVLNGITCSSWLWRDGYWQQHQELESSYQEVISVPLQSSIHVVQGKQISLTALVKPGTSQEAGPSDLAAVVVRHPFSHEHFILNERLRGESPGNPLPLVRTKQTAWLAKMDFYFQLIMMVLEDICSGISFVQEKRYFVNLSPRDCHCFWKMGQENVPKLPRWGTLPLCRHIHRELPVSPCYSVLWWSLPDLSGYLSKFC